MYIQDGKRFRRSFCGYNRTAVDAEFNRLIAQSDSLVDERDSLQTQIDTLNNERTEYSREQLKLNSTITTMTSQVMDLESNLSHAKMENETLAHEVEAHKAEKNAMQIRFDQLRERDRDFSLREREFSELQSSVSSIMSVTKRATDRLFQKTVENQERVTQIAGDAAREVASIRADMAQVRQQLNEALDEVQDRIDRVDATLTGAVHKLVAIKHDDGLHVGDDQPGILSEVERLLSMRAGEVDSSDGKNYSVPVLGPYGAKFLTDTAQRVSDGRITAKPNPAAGVEVHRVMPTQFESSDNSILEATKLLERGGMTASEFYAANPQYLPPAASPTEPEFLIPDAVVEAAKAVEEPAAEATAPTEAAIPMPAPAEATVADSSAAIPMPAPAAVEDEDPFDAINNSFNGFISDADSPKPVSLSAAANPGPVIVKPAPITASGAKLVSVRARRAPRK